MSIVSLAALCLASLIALRSLPGQSIPDIRISAEVTVLPIDGAGETIEDCFLDHFVDRHGVDLARGFQNLKAAKVPYGVYTYVLKQHGALSNYGSVEGHATVSVPQVLIVIPTSRAALQGVTAERAIPYDFRIEGRLDHPVEQTGAEPLRIRLIPVYGDSSLDVSVDQSGQFRIYTPLSGRYLLTLIRGREVLGVQQVEFEENWKSAKFVVKFSDPKQPPILHVVASQP